MMNPGKRARDTGDTLSDDALSQVLRSLWKRTGTSAASYGRERGMIWLPETMADLPVAGDGYLALTAWLMNFRKIMKMHKFLAIKPKYVII